MKEWKIHMGKNPTNPTLAGEARGEHVSLEAFEAEKLSTLLQPLLFADLWVKRFMGEVSKIHPSKDCSMTAAQIQLRHQR